MPGFKLLRVVGFQQRKGRMSKKTRVSAAILAIPKHDAAITAVMVIVEPQPWCSERPSKDMIDCLDQGKADLECLICQVRTQRKQGDMLSSIATRAIAKAACLLPGLSLV